MKRTCFAEDTCPIARSLDTVGDWWSLLIVRDALLGRKRFGEFQESLGVAKNILTDRLRKLVADGVLALVPVAAGGAYREYHLTEKGRGLIVVLVALQQWSAGDEEWKLADSKGRPVRLEFRTENGRKVESGDVTFVSEPND